MRESCKLAVEERHPGLVETGVGLVQEEQNGLVQERAAEREPLLHAVRVHGDAVVARLPEAEALEQHPDPLAPLGHAVEPAVEVEVLEGGQLAVDERLVSQEADLSARGLGTMYRLVVGPPGSRDAAAGVCNQLKTAGYTGCWVTAY